MANMSLNDEFEDISLLSGRLSNVWQLLLWSEISFPEVFFFGFFDGRYRPPLVPVDRCKIGTFRAWYYYYQSYR